MPTADEYAAWIVKNADKKGTPDFEVVANAYKDSLSQAVRPPTPAPAKPFGQQMNDAIADVPRQVGMFARYGLEGVGGTLDFLATPFRAGLNAITPNVAPTIADLVADRKPAARFQPGGGKVLADLMHLPEPATASERVVGDATRMLAGGAVPIAAAGRIAQGTNGVTKAVAETMAAKPIQQLTSAGAAGGAGGYTRETGGDDMSQFAASLAAGIATPFAVNKLASAANRVARGAPALTPQQIDITINSALQGGAAQGGVAFGDLSSSIQAGIRRDVADAYRLTGSVTPDAIRRLADYRLTGTNPTAATLTLDPAIVSQQKNLAKQGINSKDGAAQLLGRTENANNRTLIENINEIGGGSPATPIDGGRTIIGGVEGYDKRATGIIDKLYKKAKASDGRSAALDPSVFTQRAGNLLNEHNVESFLTPDIRNKLNAFAAGDVPLNVDIAEQFKTSIGKIQRASTDGNVRTALGLVRGALDDTPLLPGQNIGQNSLAAFNRARSMNRQYMGAVEKTPALQAVRDGIEPDKFVQQFIVGSGGKANVADVNALHNSIKSSPDAIRAVKEQIVAHLKAKALNGAEDEVGNLSQSAYNKALREIGDEKLGMFFTGPEVNQLRAIGRVASYEQFQPRGSAVGNSNTGAVVLSSVFDRIANSPLLSKIPFGNALSQPMQNIAVGINSGRALNVPNALAGALAPPIPRARNSLMLSPAVLAGAEDEKKR